MPTTDFLEYRDIDINAIDIDEKPTAYTGIEYPLNGIGDRNFEKLIYSLYKQEIANKRMNYDNIRLMSGIKDGGEDCVLYLNKIKCGIIQCKHSEKGTQLATKSCVEEIIKFILYSFDEDRLIPDIQSFVYFFASSSGFKTETENYLRAFNSKIIKEIDLERWTKSVIHNFSSLKYTYDSIKDRLIEALTNLNVQLITPDDIQSLLSINQSLVVPRFFQVKLVVDNSAILGIKKSIEEIKENVITKVPKNNNILEEFNEASIFLSNYKNTFSSKKPIKIERKISEEINDWIKTPLNHNEENIAILKGGAGSGKSVILTNLYHLLIIDAIPTIAFKADERSACSIVELEKKHNLSIPLEDSIKILKNTYQKIVIIIDQIDALSQTLSANRDNLSTYILLIEKLKKIPNVRIIISVREYDLNYDPYLIPFKKNRSYNAGLLKESEVIKVLTALKVNTYPKKLLDLLSTPLHLELFCQVYNLKTKNIKYNSLYDLYNELWRLKIDTRGSKEFKESLKKTIFDISSKIYEIKGSLSVGSIFFNGSDIDYLKTEGLIITSDVKDVMFFHQTFYDYVFARQFVESNKNVIAYINENNQDLYIRSCLKIILTHIREENPSSYKKLIIELLKSKKIRFHIKQLVFNYLGFIDKPTNIEKEIIETIVFNSENETIFYETVNSSNWIIFLIEIGRFNTYLTLNSNNLNVILQLFIQNIDSASKEILEYLLTIPASERNLDIISRTLYYLNEWNSNATLLFERSRDYIKSPHHYSHCLGASLSFDEDWTFNEFEKKLLNRAEELDNKNHRNFSIPHPEIGLLKKCFIQNDIRTYRLCAIIIEKIIKQTEWVNDVIKLNENRAFHFFSRTERLENEDELLNIFIDKTEKYALNNDIFFKEIISNYSNSVSATLLQVLIYGYLANPHSYYEEAFSTLKYIYKKNAFIYNDKLDYFVRVLIQTVYPLLSFNQKEELNEMIMSINPEWEIEKILIDSITKKKSIKNNKGFLKYTFLMSVPLNELRSFSKINREFQELNRKFGKIEDVESNVISSFRGVAAPYEKENYEKMSLQDWENTFYKYDEHFTDSFFSFKGGVLEHSRSFEEQVVLRPKFFYPLLEKIISNSKIVEDYKVYGITGLIKAKYDINIIHHLIVRQIANKLSDTDILFTIWNIDYLIKNDKVDDAIFNFLCKQALTNLNPDKDDLVNPSQRGINTVRGAALDKLMKINSKKFEIKLFKTINTVLNKEKTLIVKSIIAVNSAYLSRINSTKAFRIFSKLLKSDKRLLKESMWSAQYFSNSHFLQMDFFFDLAIKESKEKRVSEYLSGILINCWLNDVKKSDQYLFRLLAKSKDAKRQMIRMAVDSKNLIKDDDSLDDKCVQLFRYCLNDKDEEVINLYSIAFLHFNSKMFNSLFPLLVTYSKSTAFINNPGYFCEYLTQCCTKQTVYQCVELISKFDKLVETNISQGNHYYSEPLNAILAIYNVLSDNQKDKKFKNECLNIFDKMLQQPQHREAANKVTSLVEN